MNFTPTYNIYVEKYNSIDAGLQYKFFSKLYQKKIGIGILFHDGFQLISTFYSTDISVYNTTPLLLNAPFVLKNCCCWFFSFYFIFSSSSHNSGNTSSSVTSTAPLHFGGNIKILHSNHNSPSSSVFPHALRPSIYH